MKIVVERKEDPHPIVIRHSNGCLELTIAAAKQLRDLLDGETDGVLATIQTCKDCGKKYIADSHEYPCPYCHNDRIRELESIIHFGIHLMTQYTKESKFYRASLMTGDKLDKGIHDLMDYFMRAFPGGHATSPQKKYPEHIRRRREPLKSETGTARFLFLGGVVDGDLIEAEVEAVHFKGPHMKKFWNGKEWEEKLYSGDYTKRQIEWPGVKEGRSIPVFVSDDIVAEDEWLKTLPPGIIDRLWLRDFEGKSINCTTRKADDKQELPG